MAGNTEALDVCTAAVIEFLQSKCLFAAERALRTELELETQRAPGSSLLARNLWTSKLEVVLGAEVPRRPEEEPAAEIRDLTPVEAVAATLDPDEANLAAGACASALSEQSGKGRNAAEKKPRLHLFDVVACGHDESHALRRQRGQSHGPSRVIFRDGRPMTVEQEHDLAHVSLPLLYNPNVNGLEDSSELPISVGVVIAQRYRVVALIGKGSFSRVVQCLDLYNKKMVSVKVLRNDKDCIDQGLGEVRLLALIARSLEGGSELPLLQLLDYFYFKEHLFIVTELLRDSLFNFYRYLNASPQPAPADGTPAPSGSSQYFNLGTLATLAAQLLDGLAFLHSLNITHCDLKPENVCIVSASRRQFKIIDFGSAVMSCDCHNSYVQSRWYRAPEVMLGLPWDGKVDVWGVGCILAELLVGQPVFHGGSVELVLAAQSAVLGPHPKHMLTASELAHMYFKPDGRLYSIEPSGERRAGTMMPLPNVNLKTLTKVDDTGFLAFLASLLTIDPEQRPTAAEALDNPWLRQALEPQEPVDGMQRHKYLANVHGYQSPTSSRSGSTPTSVNSSPTSSRDTSRDSSPMRSPMRDGAADRSARPDAKNRKAAGKDNRRSSNPSVAGPGVPEEFRDAVQGDASRSHEWRQKLVRLVAPLSKGGNQQAGTPSAAAQAGGACGSGNSRPLSAGSQCGEPDNMGVPNASKSWPSSFNMRGNSKVEPTTPTPAESSGDRSRPQQAGAPPLSALHRPKMRL